MTRRDDDFLLLLSRTSGGTPTPTPTDAIFGALTVSGAGGVAVTGTTISSGDASGHWTITGGYLVPSSAGDAANLSGGAYSLVFNDGSTMTINIVANEWDVRQTSEWDTVIAQATATLTGKKIAIRPGSSIVTGVNGTAARLRRADYGGLEIYCRQAGQYADVDKFFLRGTRNVTFRRLRTTPVAEVKFQLTGEAANHLLGIVIDACLISGQAGDPYGDYAISGNYPNNGIDLITTTGAANNSVGSVTVTNSIVEWGGTCIGLRVDRDGAAEAIVTGNIVRYFYDDGIGIAKGTPGTTTWYNCKATVEDNVVYGNIGRSTDSTNPHTDAIRFISTSIAGADWSIQANRNIIFVGACRGNQHMQGILASDFKTVAGDSGCFFTGQAIGNLIVTDNAVAFNIENAKGFSAKNNTIVSSAISGGTYTPTLRIGSGSTYSTTSGTHGVERNISDAFDIGGSPTLIDNITLGKGGATITYASVFDGPSWYPNSRAEALAWFSRKAGGPADLPGPYDAGAVGSGAVVFATTSPGNNGSNNVS